jgi:DNA-binding transcriptional MerR regulator
MIPNKSNFKFQELTPITGVKPYVIRFWETEFDEICPVTSDSGQKLYAKKDIETILRIKKLLFEEKLSIPEARALMKNADQVQFSTEGIESPVPPEGADKFIRQRVLEALDLINEIKFKRKW